MTEFGKCFGDILWHRYVHIPVVVVPSKGKSKVTGTGEVFGEDVFRFKGLKEVIQISFVVVLDSEIVDRECECGAELVVFP